MAYRGRLKLDTKVRISGVKVCHKRAFSKIQKHLYMVVDCKTVRIFGYSSTLEQSN